MTFPGPVTTCETTRSPGPLADVLRQTKLLVLAGSGGVGKTTTAAALALTAACMGRRVLVLTIDPAQRLLQALGLLGEAVPANTPLEILPRLTRQLTDLGQDPPAGTLHAMMLDAESGAELMVERLLPDPSLRDQVMGNRVYRALLPMLSSSPDYVALELIASLLAEDRYDLLVLDTPPMQNAVDFLHAGGTLSAFINERVLRWFSRVPQPGEKKKFSLLGAGGSMAMAVMGRLVGGETLPDIAQFFVSFRDVMPKMAERARETDRMLRSPGTRFLLVTTPGATALREARHLQAELRSQGLPFAGFVVNRVLQVPDGFGGGAGREVALGDLRGRLQRSGMDEASADAMSRRLDQAAAGLHHLSQADEAHIVALQRLSEPHGFCAVAAEREGDVHTLAELCDLGARLLDGVRPGVVP